MLCLTLEGLIQNSFDGAGFDNIVDMLFSKGDKTRKRETVHV